MQVTSTPESEAFLASPAFEKALASDDGQAAKRHLAAGRPIYYGDDLYPEHIVKEFPDGHRQLVDVDASGAITVIRDL